MNRSCTRRAALVLTLLCGPACAAAPIDGPAAVIDGDTLEVGGTRLHLYGIDAPAIAQTCETAGGRTYACGREAARALRERIGAGPVSCERRGFEAAGRAGGNPVSATCRVGEEDLAGWMVARGHALARRQVSAAYVGRENRAWATRRGLWSGTFERPADWRRDRRRIEAAAQPDE